MIRSPLTCVHFNGIQHERCKAGVEIKSVRDSSRPGPYKWPCLTIGEPATTTCEKRRLPTVEELAAEEVEFKRAFAAIEAGTSPCCGAALDESRVKGGVGPRYCSECKSFVFRGCNPKEEPEETEDG